MSHYRSHVNGAAFIVFVAIVGVGTAFATGASSAREGRSARQPKSASTISYQHHHQHQPSASTSAESFNPLPAAAAVRGVAAFPDGEPVFVPTLPSPEKLALEQTGQQHHRATDLAVNRPSPAAVANDGDEVPDDVERHPAAQKLYPNFFRNIPPLGHSRPYYQPNDAIIDQRYNGKIRVAAGGLPAGGAVLPEVVTAAAAASSLLGSGDFGVIKGGTFYYDTDVPQKGGGYIDDFYGLGFASNSNNGHGRPQLAYLVQKAAAGPPKEEQFSNFRDFADINISNDPAYSHQAPRYLYLPTPTKDHEPSGGGGSRNTTERAPDNILDELRSLDGGLTRAPDPTTVTNRGTGVRAKLKKDPVLTLRKKRPKTEVRDQEPDSKSASDGDDYMVAAS